MCGPGPFGRLLSVHEALWFCFLTFGSWGLWILWLFAKYCWVLALNVPGLQDFLAIAMTRNSSLCTAPALCEAGLMASLLSATLALYTTAQMGRLRPREVRLISESF